MMGKCHTYHFIQWLIPSKASHISFLTVQLNIQQCNSTPRWSKGLIWLASWWESWFTSAHPVDLMVDTEAMFHQVHVQEQCRDVLCSLWWPWGDTDQPPTCYHMTVHFIRGIWSMNYCTYVLRQTLSDNSHLYSKKAQTRSGRTSMWTIAWSVISIGEAISLSQELKSMLARGGFNLMCNGIAVFKRIPLVDQFKNEKEGPWCTPGWKSPGCVWNIEDWLSYRVQHMDKPLTKQRLLSTLSSVYDPLGLASPFILKARKVFQDLCPVKRNWDELIGPDH